MKYKVLVKEIMRNDVKKVDLDETVENAAKIMKKFNISSVVVMGEKNIKGIVTESDIVYKYVAEKKGEKVSDIMTKDLVTIDPGKSIEDAAELMAGKGIKKLLVFDKERLVGVVSQSDILRVEPALFDILLEQLKMKGPGVRGPPSAMVQCENCGNYVDDVTEIDGVWMCSECLER